MLEIVTNTHHGGSASKDDKSFNTEVEEICLVFGASREIFLEVLPFFTSNFDHLTDESISAFLLSRILQMLFKASHRRIDTFYDDDQSSHSDLLLQNDAHSIKNNDNDDSKSDAKSLTVLISKSKNYDDDGALMMEQYSSRQSIMNFDHLVFTQKVQSMKKNSTWIGAIGIVTDMLELKQNLKPREYSILEKKNADETVLEVVQACLELFEKNDEKFQNTLESIHEKYFKNFVIDDEEGPLPQCRPESFGIDHLRSMVCSILRNIKQKIEVDASLFGDFNYLWTNLCNQFEPCFDEASLKKCTWMLQAAFFLNHHQQTCDNFEEYKDKSLLAMAATILLVSFTEQQYDSHFSKKRKVVDSEVAESDCTEDIAIEALSMMTNPDKHSIKESKIKAKAVERISVEMQVPIAHLVKEIEVVSNFICEDFSKELSISGTFDRVEILKDNPTSILESIFGDIHERKEGLQVMKKMYTDAVIHLLTSTKVDIADTKSILSIFSSFGLNAAKLSLNLCQLKMLTTSAKVTLPKVLNEKSRTITSATDDFISSISASDNNSSKDKSAKSIQSDTKFINDPPSSQTTLRSCQTNEIHDNGVLSLTEWINRLYENSSLHKPSYRLMLHIEHSELNRFGEHQLWPSIVSTLNSVFENLIKSYNDSSEDKTFDRTFYIKISEAKNDTNNESSPDKASFFNKSDSSGSYSIISNLDSKTKRIFTSLLALYYTALEQILVFESRRLQTTMHCKLLGNQNFHRSILALCCECVIKVHTPEFTTESILHSMDIDGYELFKVMEIFLRCMSKSGSSEGMLSSCFREPDNMNPLALPEVISRFLVQRETEMLDAGIWVSPMYQRSGGLVNAIAHLHQSQSRGLDVNAWPPPCLEYDMDIDDDDEIRNLPVIISMKSTTATKRSGHALPVELILRKTLLLCARRTLQLAQKLEITDSHIHRIWVSLRFFLRNHIYALYDHHIDHIILCCLYAICKITLGAPEITFSKIIEVYKEINHSRGESCNQKIIRHILLEDRSDGTLVFGNIIQFYNKIFVPTMKPHLMKNSDVEFLTKQKKKTTLVMEHIVKTARLSNLNASSFSGNGNSNQKQENIIFRSEIKSSDEPLEIPRGRVFYHFGGGRVVVSFKNNLIVFTTWVIAVLNENKALTNNSFLSSGYA